MENQSSEDMLDEAAACGNILVYLEGGRPQKFWAHNGVDTVFFWGAGKNPQSREIKGSVTERLQKKRNEGYEPASFHILQAEGIDERRYFKKKEEREKLATETEKRIAAKEKDAVIQKGRETLLAGSSKPAMQWF